MRTRLLFLLGVLALGPACSIAVKGGRHAFDSEDLERIRKSATFEVVELEVGVREFQRRPVDLTVAIDLVEAPDGTDFQDFRLTSRYVFRKDKRFSPYAGGGFGWYRWFTKDVAIIPPPLCEPTILDPDRCAFLENVTISDGGFWHGLAGLSFSIVPSVELVLEDRVDFSKDDGGVDFGSHQIQLGVRGRLDW